MARIRPMAVVPFLMGLISFILTVIVLIAGTKEGRLEDFSLMTLNVSNVGKNLITFTPTNTSAAASTSTTTSTAASSTASSTDPLANILDIMPTSDIPASLTAPFSSLESGLTSTIDDGLQQAVNSIVKNLIQELDLKDFYSFYLSNTCEGSYAPNSTAPNAKKNTTVCKSSSKSINITELDQIPTYLVVGTTNISVPAIGIVVKELKKTQKTLDKTGTAVFALFIIVAVTSFLTMALSPLLFFVPTQPLPHTRTAKLSFYTLLGVSELANIFQLIAAIILTATVGIANKATSDFKPLGLDVKPGNKFTAVIWIVFVLTLISTVYLLFVYWAEYRTWSFARRELGSEDEQGDLMEMKRRIRRPIGKDEV